MPPETQAAPATLPSVLVIDDHPVVLQGLCAVLRGWPEFRLAGSAATPDDARRHARELQPQAVVVDLILGGIRGMADGLALISELRAELTSAAILVLTAVEDATLARRSMDAGANGYLLKSEPIENLRHALVTVLKGRPYLSPVLFATAPETDGTPVGGIDRSEIGRRFGRLTNREMNVLHATALEFPNRRIAAELCISVKTVEAHKESIKRKLNLADAGALSAAAEVYLRLLAR
jgi:two-component system, NarL family, response regulator NreC